MTNPNPLEVVQNLILDTLEPFIERLAVVEADIDYLRDVVTGETSVQAAGEAHSHEQEPAKAETPSGTPNGATVLPAAVEEVLALHRLDATPMQWVFQNGKRESAPDGMWEITCAVCSDHKIDWRTGDPEPPRCKTVKILTRGY